MTINYKDFDGARVLVRSRTLSGEQVPAHDVSQLPGTVESDIGATNTSTAALAALIVSGALKTVLQTGANAIGKLAANAGINIGSVDVLTLPALATGANAIGKLAANTAATYIGDVVLQAGTAAFGKLSANTAATYIGDVVLQAGTAAFGKLSANTAATYIGDVILQAGTAAIGKLAANSGVIIGDVNVVSAPSPNSAGPFTQASSTLSTSAVQLSSQVVKHGVWIINTHATNNVFVGPSTVTNTGANVGFILRPFEVLFQPVANFNQVWLIASAASTSYTVIGN